MRQPKLQVTKPIPAKPFPLPSKPTVSAADPGGQIELTPMPAGIASIADAIPIEKANSFVFNKFLVIVLSNPNVISDLQKAWGRVSPSTTTSIPTPKAVRYRKISPIISIKYKRLAKASGAPSEWNTAAIRRVPRTQLSSKCAQKHPIRP